MKIIVPMAGMGKRMRPHTLTVPKPLVPVCGKPIVERLVTDIAAVNKVQIDEVAFIIGPSFGKAVEEQLTKVAENIGAKASIYYQHEALGTAHAIYCAQESMEGNIVVAFADTLFSASFELDADADGIIWTKRVEDPRAFGVVNKDENGFITEFEEKPENPKSDEAIIGIYYFKDGLALKKEIEYLLDNKITDKGEYQITDALENMKNKGLKLKSGIVDEWMDCGNKNVTVQTNQRYLDIIQSKEKLMADDVQIENSTIIQPCYISSGVVITNSVIGPHVSVGSNTKISHSIVNNSIIQSNSQIKGLHCTNSMIGNFTSIEKKAKDLSVGDYNQIIE